VPFQPAAKPLVLLALLLAETLNLNEVRNHFFQYLNKSFCKESVLAPPRDGPEGIIGKA
jgi:hypothetical protein